MWFLYSHYDQAHEFFDNKEEAITMYKKWKEDFKKDLKQIKDETGEYDNSDICTEMIILSKVIHRIDFDDEARGGYKIYK